MRGRVRRIVPGFNSAHRTQVLLGMRGPRGKLRWRHFARKAVSLLALTSYFAFTIGFPLPRLLAKGRGQPFLCQSHDCGCRSAEQCWQHCCCFSAEERWSWAQEQHVQPPAYAERPSTQGWNRPRLRDRECAACPKKPSTEPDELKRASCCADHEREKLCCKSSNAEKPVAKPSQSTGLPRIAAQHCHGLKGQWTSGGTGVSPIPVTSWQLLLPPGTWVTVKNTSSLIANLVPPDPPPRTFSS
jgi:hypothetical protein